jgi:hypothetical protein
MMIAPLPPVRGGPCTEDGFTATTSMPVAAAVANTACSPSCFERSYTDRYEPRWAESSVPTVPGRSPSVAADDV